MTPEEVLVLYGRAWFERDREARIEALRRACTEDILFMDPQLGRLHGLEDGRIRLITVWSGSEHFPIPASTRG